MRKSNLKTIIILTLMIASSLFNNFIYQIYGDGKISFVIFLAVFLGISIILLGYQKDKSLNKTDIIQIMIIYCFTYLIITYIAGIAFGFAKSPYNIKNLLKNISIPLLVIILEELLRYILIVKNNKEKVVFLIPVTFSVVEILIALHRYPIYIPMDIFKLIGFLILPTIITNILLTFITEKCGFIPSIIYRIILELYVYIVPIYPDFGIYIQSLLYIVFPTILFLRINSLYSKKTYKAARKDSFKNIIINIPLIGLLTAIVALVSGLFSLYAMAIASDSMVPTFKRGDVVIIEKIKDYKIENLKVGDIVVYNHDNKMIVHRINAIKTINNEIAITTKGDNNESLDTWQIKTEEIKGVVTFTIPYIGYPSVWLEEKLSKGE